MRVLVVDDNHANREVAKHVLLMHGHDPWVVGSGGQAEEIAGTERFDLVLMDINMPGMCGCETTLRLRALEAPGWRAPIFALTAYHADNDRKLYEDVGLDGVLSKPLDIEAMYRLLEDYTSPQTFQTTQFDQLVRQHGAVAVMRCYNAALEEFARLNGDAPPVAFKHAATVAEGLGFDALRRRLIEAARVPGRWREVCASAVQTETRAAERFFRAARAAARFPGRDARSA